ncbi:MAG: bifunctional diaminohydroxyphosphoribosylaminopyrimidine deaminase/5-amino-6-(5-phosphoribosylamino)uracil reductase RibD [Candidatus Muirbacterium halophilum]|nr:bifunctional diaminohydroxyphosphoribosylaminopyrimidine deaminase/5-amino-6-(5-phosphoribosylamino)uracil reductase RibD [Candidatus Muirbacterium halophilum]
MKQCLDLALYGQGIVSPNPLVGCIIVKDNKIISTGFHGENGFFHAERVALMKPGNYEGATLFVNLQPCSHFGNTPPCTDIIIEKKISKVIYGIEDPNIDSVIYSDNELKKNRIIIEKNILRKECILLNRFFFINHKKNRPYIFGKWGQTIDGKIADYKFKSKFITNNQSRQHSHNLRFSADGILVGINTVLNDNPMLNIRLKKSKNLKRIVIDPDLSIKTDCNLVKTAKKISTIIFSKAFQCEKELFLKDNGVIIRKLEDFSIKNILRVLYIEFNVKILMLEGGGKTLGKFLKKKLLDEIFVYIAPIISGDKNSVSCSDRQEYVDIDNFTQFKFLGHKIIEDDILLNYIGESVNCLLE